MAETKKAGIKDFPFNYWVTILFEFFERGSYYGMMSILSVYMTDTLGFSKDGLFGTGTILAFFVAFFVYGLPMITGAIADKMGYRKTLMVAFGLLGSGYFFASQNDDHLLFFLSLLVIGLGAGTFKPIISGTIAKITDERTSTLGFSIFYWTINLGAFLFPTFLVPWLKGIDASYIFLASAIGTGAMVIPTLLLYKEPPREEADMKKEPLGATLKAIFTKVGMVFKDYKFILFIVLYSFFWVLYFQMFQTVLWYVRDFVDATSLNNAINGSILSWINSIFSSNITFNFDIEHVTSINALTIIFLQIVIAAIVKKTKPMPTMLTGIAIGTIGMALLAISSNIWVFMTGIMIFSIGEMTAHPKYIAYLGMIAPSDKKATYMGFGFVYGIIGSFIGNIFGAKLYVIFMDNPMINFIKSKIPTGSELSLAADATLNEALEVATKLGIEKAEVATHASPSELWLIFSGIGVFCIIGLLAYQKFIGTKSSD